MSVATVLLVDDEEEFVAVLAERLALRDFDVATAESGEAAIVQIKEQRFDAVLLDMAMPGMDGVATLTAALEINPDLQVILLTGRSTLTQAAAVMKLGAMDLLEKPADIEVIIDRIDQAARRTIQLFEDRANQKTKDILKKKGW